MTLNLFLLVLLLAAGILGGVDVVRIRKRPMYRERALPTVIELRDGERGPGVVLLGYRPALCCFGADCTCRCLPPPRFP